MDLIINSESMYHIRKIAIVGALFGFLFVSLFQINAYLNEKSGKDLIDAKLSSKIYNGDKSKVKH